MGPSLDYIELLQGRITSEEYVERVKEQVNARIKESVVTPEDKPLRRWWQIWKRR